VKPPLETLEARQHGTAYPNYTNKPNPYLSMAQENLDNGLEPFLNNFHRLSEFPLQLDLTVAHKHTDSPI
jgi:hypothetical protein